MSETRPVHRGNHLSHYSYLEAPKQVFKVRLIVSSKDSRFGACVQNGTTRKGGVCEYENSRMTFANGHLSLWQHLPEAVGSWDPEGQPGTGARKAGLEVPSSTPTGPYRGRFRPRPRADK